MLAFSSQLLTLAAIATACLAPFVAGQSPTYMYAGPKCGDVETSTCPGKPYPGSSFSGAFCGAAFGASPGLTYQTLPTFSVQACANACRHYAAFGVLSWRSVCWCMDSANSNPTSVTSCGTRDQRSYYHEPLQASAGLARRQLASERRARERDTTLCPTGLTACRVESSEDGYECLDTASELESCGGCRHGIFSAVLASASLPDRKKAQNLLERRGQSALSLRADVSGPIGVDCSDRRTFGPNMTCRQGSCVSF